MTITLAAQNTFAEYIACTQEDSSYIYLDTPSLQLNIPEALSIPANDNFFKGLFTMTQASPNNFLANIKGKDVSFTECDENSDLQISVSFSDSENGQIKVTSDCTNGSHPANYEIYKSKLTCTRY